MSRITNLRQIIDNLTARNKLDSTKKYTIEEPWTMPSIDGKFQYIVLATEPQLDPETNTWSWKEILRNSSLERLYLRNINNGKIETVHEFPLNSKVIVDQLGVTRIIPDFNEIISYDDDGESYKIEYVDINDVKQTHIIPKEDAEEPAEPEEGTEEADTASIATDLSTLDDEEEEELDPAEAALIAAEEEAALIAAEKPSEMQENLIRLVCNSVVDAILVLKYEDEDEHHLSTVKYAANAFLTEVGDKIQKSSDDSEQNIKELAADFDTALVHVPNIVFRESVDAEELKSKLDEITGLNVPVEEICGEEDVFDIPEALQAEYDALTEEVNEEKENQMMQEVENVEQSDETQSDSTEYSTKDLLDKIASHPHYIQEANEGNLKDWGFFKEIKFSTIKSLREKFKNESNLLDENKVIDFYKKLKKKSHIPPKMII